MMKVLAIGRAGSGIGWEDIAPYVREEARHVWELYESDRVREFYLRADDRPGVVLVLECDDLAEAERLVAALPVLKAGLLDFEVIPLRPYVGPRWLFEDPT
jgi:hypothetical protein